PPLPRAGQPRAWWRVPASRSALAWHAARAATTRAAPLLLVARDSHAAHQLAADLQTLFGEDGELPVVLFPDWETLPWDRFSPHPDIVSQRLSTLLRLPSLDGPALVIVPVQTLLQRLPPLRHAIGGAFDMRVGQPLDLDAEKRRLESAGYRNVPQVYDPGDFAVRGGLLDVYPMGADGPYRIELFDREIESIRGFDPETQRSLDHVEAVRMLPGREVPTDEASLAAAFDALRERFDIDTRRSALAQDLKAGLAPAGIEYYLPLFFKSTATLFDYLPAGTLPLVDEGALEAADTFWKQADDRHEQLRHDIERPILPPAELWLTPDALRERLNQGDRIELCGEAHPRHAQAAKLGDQPAPSLPLALRDAVPGASLREFIASYPGRTLIAADSAGRREALLEMLDAAGLQPAVLPDFPSFASGPAAADGSPRFAIAVAPLDD